jgi:hypothetical protein
MSSCFAAEGNIETYYLKWDTEMREKKERRGDEGMNERKRAQEYSFPSLFR